VGRIKVPDPLVVLGAAVLGVAIRGT
jgi:hypothetical protein